MKKKLAPSEGPTLEEQNASAIAALFVLINKMGNDKELAEQFANELRRTHRTLQQCMIGVLKHVIEDYAESDQWDLRNEASVKWAKAVKTLAKSAPGCFPGPFPFI